MKRFIGIDGGGTKTRCVVVDGDGKILGSGLSGSANYLKDGLHVAKSSLQSALERALRQSETEPGEIACAGVGLAGVFRESDRKVMGRVIQDLLPGVPCRLESDALVTLVGATEGRPGLVVICGTGSIAFGVNQDGEQARAGGWGYVVGDEGSGYDLARKGVMAALHAFDGRGPGTALVQGLKEELYLESLDQLIPLLYGGAFSPANLATLYPVILRAAEAGDGVALRLLHDAARELVAAAMAVLSRLKVLEYQFPVALSGGVFGASPFLREEFFRRLEEKAPRAVGIRASLSPEAGAALMARRHFENSR